MSTYGWQKDIIENSSINDSLKKLLLADLANNPVYYDPSLPNQYSSFYRFKKNYHQSLQKLIKEIPELTNIALTGYKVIDIKECFLYNPPQITVTPQDLIDSTHAFYEFLADKDLLRQYDILLKHPQIFKFQEYDENNPLCQELKGRCFISEETNDAYLSFYIHHNLEDFSSFAHESAHLVIETLYKGQINPLISKYFSEFIAYYIQLLSYYFYSIHFNKPHLFPLFLHNHIVNIVNTMWELHMQQLMVQRKILRPNPQYINKLLAQEGYQILMENSEIRSFYNNPTKNIQNTNAFLVALDLFMQNNNIQEKIRSYKEMITSHYTTIDTLFSQYNITYPHDNLAHLRECHTKSLQFH